MVRSDGQLLSRRADEDAREQQLLSAALDLLVDSGYEAMTMDALAKHAHVSKATIYRRWSGKADLIVDALQGGAACYDGVDRGSLRADLLVLGASFDTEDDRAPAILSATAHAVRTDPDLAAAVRERLAQPLRDASMAVVERAIGRGEVPAAARDLTVFADLLPSLLLCRMLMPTVTESELSVAQIVDTVLLPVLLAAQ
jgi:AcrR family transcriptional regulator